MRNSSRHESKLSNVSALFTSYMRMQLLAPLYIATPRLLKRSFPGVSQIYRCVYKTGDAGLRIVDLLRLKKQVWAECYIYDLGKHNGNLEYNHLYSMTMVNIQDAGSMHSNEFTCKTMWRPATLTSLLRKSSPVDGLWTSENFLLTYCRSREVFPTLNIVHTITQTQSVKIHTSKSGIYCMKQKVPHATSKHTKTEEYVVSHPLSPRRITLRTTLSCGIVNGRWN